MCTQKHMICRCFIYLFVYNSNNLFFWFAAFPFSIQLINFLFTFLAYITKFHSNCFSVNILLLFSSRKNMLCLFIYFCPFHQLIYSALAPVHSQGELSAFRIFTLYYKVTSHKYATFLGYQRHKWYAIMRQVYYVLWQKCVLLSSPNMIVDN